MSDDRRDPPHSLPQLRQGLKQALAETRPEDADRRKELGRALAAIERAERKTLDKGARPC
jgi:hypothetical protein